MTVVSLRVEANGWVLAVRGAWSATPGAWEFGGQDRPNARFLNSGIDQFPLDPGGTPRLSLAVQDAGFDRVAGLPSANSNRARTVVATKALRKAFNADGDGAASAEKLDEFDHGDGTRTVRFALSDRIYSSTTIVSAAFLTGWKAGEGGGVVNIVTNASTRAAPLPIFRWANEPWPYVGGTVGSPVHTTRVELIVATHHPEHDGGNLHQACAAVRLRAFDGTTTKDFFFTAPQTSPLYADNLRCWGGEIDLTGLSAGPITVHATVYPWIGPERSTGTGHSTDINAALQTDWGTPFHLWYDPDGTVWPRRYVDIDPVGGTATAANVVWRDSQSAAQSAAASTKPSTFLTAMQAILSGTGGAQTLPARNGFLSYANACAWWEVLLPEATVELTANISTANARSGMGYLVVRGRPAAADPRASCIMRSSTARRTPGSMGRIKFADCTLQVGETDFFNAQTNSWTTLENVNIRAKPGFTGGGFLFQSANLHSQFRVDARNTGQQGTGWQFRNVTRTAMISTAAVAAMINVRINVPEAGDHAPARTGGIFNAGTTNADDLMLWNCEAYACEGLLLSGRVTTFGTDEASRRWALVNVLAEGTAGTGELMIIGETIGRSLQDSVIEGVTLVGARWNFHNDVEILSSTSDSAAVRVNNAPTTTIRVGLMAHGMSTGDTINVSGFTGSAGTNLNRTGVAVTVLDANRFEYTAAAGVTSTSNIGGVGTVTCVTGAMAGQPARTIVRPNLRHTGNVIRYSSFDRNGTKHDLFNGAANLTGSWELMFGVGFRGNVNANRGTSSPPDFQYAFYGIGSEAALNFGAGGQADVESWAVNWHGYVDDRSRYGPLNPSHTNNGDYRAHTITAAPFKPSRLLNKGNGVGVTDRDARGGVKGATFDGGALGRLSVVTAPKLLQPVAGTSQHKAANCRLDWLSDVVAADAVSSVVGGAAALTIPAAVRIVTGRLLQVEAEGNRIEVDRE